MFSVPQMPLEVYIWRATTVPPAGLPDVITVGNLAWGKRVNVPSTGGTASLGYPLMTMQLLLPPLTDVRGDASFVAADVVEVPSGSGRYYRVVFVDDFGKGFPNEHRGAIIYQASPWPVPTP